MLKNELKAIRETLEKTVAEKTNEEQKSILLTLTNPLYDDFPLDTAFYSRISPDLLVKSLKPENSKTVQQAHRVINRFNTIYSRLKDSSLESVVEAQISELEKTLQLVLKALDALDC